jgi:hypothetical protein
VGIAWDVATFWPRSFHPLCPPCYAERAVPETQSRLLRIWAAGGAVDLLGHSQGAIVVTAAIAGLPEDRQPPANRLALITYGNPLIRLYARHFPCYVDDGLVATVSRRLCGDWTNVYRDTDPIGAPIGRRDESPVRDIRLPDPATDRYLAGDLVPRVRGHAERGYRCQTPFVALVDAAVARLRPDAGPSSSLELKRRRTTLSSAVEMDADEAARPPSGHGSFDRPADGTHGRDNGSAGERPTPYPRGKGDSRRSAAG